MPIWVWEQSAIPKAVTGLKYILWGKPNVAFLQQLFKVQE
jgi:hypothetical protein